MTSKTSADNMAPVNVLMVGTGEYTTGFVGGSASTSDKKVGVVGLTMFDLRRRGKVDKLSMCGVSGKKFPAIREHLQKNISDVYSLDTGFTSFPANDKTDPDAYKTAIDALSPGSAITIFTPDNTHFPIAKYAIERKIHVLITKPATKTLSDHLELLALSRKNNVFVYIEHHKRFDPAYADARYRAAKLGDFNYFYSYMSQPKSQLATFSSWAGKDSDISYYLNSHHIDICEWLVSSSGWRPTLVRASSSLGIAHSEPINCVSGTEDTITLLVDWTHPSKPNSRATAIFTASWTAPQNAGVHSQQHFHYIGTSGEINVNQAKRGYEVTSDSSSAPSDAGPHWYNPFYVPYAPNENGEFAGQSGYGYVSFEKFIDAVAALNAGTATLDDLDNRGKKTLPTLGNTVMTTAILEAGRRSLDGNGKRVEIVVAEDGGVSLK